MLNCVSVAVEMLFYGRRCRALFGSESSWPKVCCDTPSAPSWPRRYSYETSTLPLVIGQYRYLLAFPKPRQARSARFLLSNSTAQQCAVLCKCRRAMQLQDHA